MVSDLPRSNMCLIFASLSLFLQRTQWPATLGTDLTNRNPGKTVGMLFNSRKHAQSQVETKYVGERGVAGAPTEVVGNEVREVRAPLKDPLYPCRCHKQQGLGLP